MAERRKSAAFTIRAGACGKREFLTFTHANTWAKKARRAQHTRISVYRCPACRAWHAGHTHRRKQRRPQVAE
jgi:hypothetical protein